VVGSHTSNIWIAANFSNTACGVTPRRQGLQSALQRYLQAVSEKRNEDVRLYAVLQLMINSAKPNSLWSDWNATSICISWTYRSHNTAGSSATKFDRNR